MILALALALLATTPGLAFETLMGSYQGRTPRGGECDVKVSRPGEVHVTISTVTSLMSTAFGSIQLRDQWGRSVDVIQLVRVDGDVYGAVTKTATLKLDGEKVLMSAKLALRESDILGEVKTRTLECRDLIKQ